MRKITLALLTILLINVVFAQKQKSLLWQVTGPKLTKPTFLFGTMHLLNNNVNIVSPVIKDYLKQSEKLFLEVDMANLDMTQLMAVMMPMLSGGGKEKLSNYLSSNELEAVKKAAQKASLPFEMLDGMKPILTEMLLKIDMDALMKNTKTKTDNNAAGMGFSGAINGAEMQLMEAAKEIKLTTGGLETATYQLGIFDAIPFEAQARNLAKSILTDNTDTNKTTPKGFEELEKLYLEQDLDKIAEMMNDTASIEYKYADILLYQRNQNWADTLAKILPENKPLFIAVGAAHLPGAKGLIQLLRDKGFEVTPLLYTPIITVDKPKKAIPKAKPVIKKQLKNTKATKARA
jgi:uncharacterized protein